MATPASNVKPTPPAAGGTPPAAGKPAKPADRRLRADDILKLMVADGLVPQAEADRVAKSRTHQYEHALELIAAQKWRSEKPPGKLLTLEALVEWLAGKLKVPYFHIDPLKIDLSAVTATMSNDSANLDCIIASN